MAAILYWCGREWRGEFEDMYKIVAGFGRVVLGLDTFLVEPILGA